MRAYGFERSAGQKCGTPDDVPDHSTRALVADEALHPDSRVEAMQARLRELDQPIYGTKDRVWPFTKYPYHPMFFQGKIRFARISCLTLAGVSCLYLMSHAVLMRERWTVVFGVG